MYNGLSREEIFRIYSFVTEKRKEGFGQRKIYKMIKTKFNTEIKESTISNWIFYKKIPFGNERTQFKPKQRPPKKELYKSYITDQQSAQNISKNYDVSVIVIINWLKYYNIPLRTHIESMNTSRIRGILREKKLKKPTKEYSNLSFQKSYILGVLCGDAYINNRGIRLEIRRDKEFINGFAECIKKVYGLTFKPYYYPKRNSFVLYTSNELICSDLLNYGKFGTFDWKVPEQIQNSDNKSVISNFLRGIYDSEGYSSKYCIGLVSANKEGVKGISLLLNKLQIRNSTGLIKNGKYFRIYITGRENLKSFKERVGFTIQRKLDNLNFK